MAVVDWRARIWKPETGAHGRLTPTVGEQTPERLPVGDPLPLRGFMRMAIRAGEGQAAADCLLAEFQIRDSLTLSLWAPRADLRPPRAVRPDSQFSRALRKASRSTSRRHRAGHIDGIP